MSARSPNVVYDCNVFVQALINPVGPAGECLQKVRGRSPAVRIALRIAGSPGDTREGPVEVRRHRRANRGTRPRTRVAATMMIDIPEVYHHPFDPDDSQYVNLAVLVQAGLIVSRDRHLLNLMDVRRKEGAECQILFPALRILDPVEFLRELHPKPG